MIFLAVIICALAIYGAFTLAKYVAAYFRDAGPEHALRENLVMFVKNQEPSIEGIVRSAAWRELSGIGQAADGIVVVDLGSEDETFEILMRLQNEYEFVYAMSREQYIEKIQEM